MERNDLDERIRRLELLIDDLRRRFEALEHTVSGIEQEVRDIAEAESLGATQ